MTKRKLQIKIADVFNFAIADLQDSKGQESDTKYYDDLIKDIKKLRKLVREVIENLTQDEVDILADTYGLEED